jgi:N-acetyl-gamma-glutamyl-phosphate reductase
MTIRIFIDGAAGTTGLEIRDRLQGREEFELIVLDDGARKDVSARREALHEADVAILCLPDDAAREAVKLAEGSDTRIIDASSAHRVADGWTYGFPELIGHEKIAEAQFVSNPGCYPTGFLALVAPLIKEDLLLWDWPYTVHAVSGFSGGGNALIDRFAEETDIAFRGYGLGGKHKHLAEMKRYGGFHCALEFAPVFSPSVVPAHRGMIVEVPLTLAGMHTSATPNMLWQELTDFYESSSIVSVHDINDCPNELLVSSGAASWDGIELLVAAPSDQLDDQNAGSLRLIARLDNLGKGASGAAIQNLNIMCGLPETTGLRL